MRLARLACIGAFALVALAGASGAAKAYSPIGQQRLLVVLIEHAHQGCPADATELPTCPRRTAAEWETILNQDLNNFFGANSYGQNSWSVRVLAHPGNPSGWWPSSYTNEERSRRGQDNFTTSFAIVRDAAENIVGQALTDGLIRRSELDSYQRFLVLDNYHRRGGQAGGQNFHIPYYPGGPGSEPWLVTAAVAAEDTADANALNVIHHELGHELGFPDLYTANSDTDPPCPWTEPGGIAATSTGRPGDCMGPWDEMGRDAEAREFGFYIKHLGGWVNDGAESVRYLSRSASESVTLSVLERPTGDPLALRLPLDPNPFPLVAGSPVFFRGLQVECRNNHNGRPRFFVSYVDQMRGTNSPQKAVRAEAGEDIERTGFLMNATYTNTELGIRLFFRNRTDSRCIVDVNRDRIDAASLRAASPYLAQYGQTAQALMPGRQYQVFGNSGVALNGLGAKASQRRGRRISAVRRGRRVRVRFSYVNTGSRPTRGGVATVRASQPYAVEARCDGLVRPLGKIVKRVRLRSLAPGRGASRSISFRARSSAPIGVSVSFRSRGEGVLASDDFEQSALAFASHARRRGGRARPQRLTVVARTHRSCHDAAEFSASPLLVPRGWRARPTSREVLPGRSARLHVRVIPPRGARGSVAIPIGVTGPSNHVSSGGNPFGHEPPALLGGFDVLARIYRPGGGGPAFVLPPAPPRPPSAPAYPPLAPPLSPPPPPEPSPSTISLVCPAELAQGNAGSFSGAITPPKPGAPVHLTYTSPTNKKVEHDVLADETGAYKDSFAGAELGSWTAVAAWPGDATHLGASSAPCKFTIAP